MDLKTQFNQAAEDVKKLSSRPDNQTLLELYALLNRPLTEMSPVRVLACSMSKAGKIRCLGQEKGLSCEAAMKDYIALVTKLIK